MTTSDFSWSIKHSAIIRGFACPPTELTRRLRLRPTRALVAGEPISAGSRRVARISVWDRTSKEWRGDTGGVNAGKHLRGLSRLVEEMHAHRRVIASVVPPGEFYFYSVLHTDSPNVCIRLPLALARRMSELNAEWTCSVWGPGRLASFLNEDE